MPSYKKKQKYPSHIRKLLKKNRSIRKNKSEKSTIKKDNKKSKEYEFAVSKFNVIYEEPNY